ncbi:alpha/beta hydrolase [uncultured Endozoicomonas sp.]|uniref:alpha/beta hydrolase n=1 Tax=uncultured Endozoicomonas sp. TaxID=432652 RepID=UPI00262BEAE1|nr:alpha/beta hydrolase [uncultured Endozoicomonas sp.]
MQPEAITISTPHLTFSAVQWGDPDGHPVIALHGWLDNLASFTPMAPHLQGIRLIAVDQAGHGHSQHRPAGFSYDVWHYVEDLLYIADALKLDKFGLVGHSLGAVVCTMAAGSVLKDRLTGLVAIDGLFPRPRKPEESPGALTRYILQRQTPTDQLPKTVYRSKQQAIRARTLSEFKVSSASAELLVDRSMREVDDGWVWTHDARLKLGSPTRFTLEQTLAFPNEVICPAHVVYASKGVSGQIVDEFAHQLPHFVFHAMEGHHHLHMDDQVESVAAVVNSVFSSRV